jgi:HlyD family secretion protein
MRLQVLPLNNRWLIGLMVAATSITGAIVFYGSRLGRTGAGDSSQPVMTPTVRKVVALGRLEPEAEVIQLSAPNPVEASRVAQLLVSQGDRVKPGQVIAILDARDRLQHELKQAKEQVSVAQAKLAQVKAGAKSGEIQAQKATIDRFQAEQAGELSAQGATVARWQSEVRNARAQHNRFQQLHRAGAISTSDLEAKRLALETSQAQLNEAIAIRNRTISSLQAQLSEATATLNQIVEVRPVDVQAAQTEVNTAIAAMQRAEADLQRAYVRAPIAGQIFKIHTRSGEKIDEEKGIVELGQTNQMVVAAEVYQTDISKVQVGQQAVITSQVFPGELRGTVSQIGLQVNQQEVFSNQPGENLDRRVIEVKIRLTPKDSKRVASFTNLQVQTAIQL